MSMRPYVMCLAALGVPLAVLFARRHIGDPKANRRYDADRVPNAGWVASRSQTPDIQAVPSELANFPWAANVSCEVGKEYLEAYDRDGYVFLPQVLDTVALDMLLDEAQSICKGQLQTRGVCQIEQLRWQVNRFRDFMFYSSLGCIAHKLMRSDGVRIETEALFGTRWNPRDPHFFSYSWHTDSPGGHKGTYHGFPTGTRGVSAWFPLHDVDHAAQGGSIWVVPGYTGDNVCKHSSCGGLINPTGSARYNCTIECLSFNACGPEGCHRWEGKTFDFKKGDAVFWHSDMPHKTQRVVSHEFTRHSFTIRLVDSDATLCNVGMACGDWMGCCKDLPLEAGRKIHHHCFPQIYPKVLDHEVAAHFGPTPKHLMGTPEWNHIVHLVPPSPDCV